MAGDPTVWRRHETRWHGPPNANSRLLLQVFPSRSHSRTYVPSAGGKSCSDITDPRKPRFALTQENSRSTPASGPTLVFQPSRAGFADIATKTPGLRAATLEVTRACAGFCSRKPARRRWRGVLGAPPVDGPPSLLDALVQIRRRRARLDPETSRTCCRPRNGYACPGRGADS